MKNEIEELISEMKEDLSLRNRRLIEGCDINGLPVIQSVTQPGAGCVEMSDESLQTLTDILEGSSKNIESMIALLEEINKEGQ